MKLIIICGYIRGRQQERGAATSRRHCEAPLHTFHSGRGRMRDQTQPPDGDRDHRNHPVPHIVPDQWSEVCWSQTHEGTH